MATFDLVSVLLSIVISLALAHLLAGIAHIIENGFRRFSIPLAQWIAFCLFLCVDYWFTIWSARTQTSWSLGYVCLLLLQASLIYITSRLVVPTPSGAEQIDLTAFFDRNRRKFMGVITTLAVVNEATNLTLQRFNTSLLGLMVLTWVVLFAIAWRWASYRVQLIVAAANVVLTAWYAVTFIPAL
jgi:hypothetical protein